MQKHVFNGEVKLWTESFGQQKNPAILLVLGTGSVSTIWYTPFCEQLAQAGFFVIRYDQRDYGRSTHFPSVDSRKIEQLRPGSKPPDIPYTIGDLVLDAWAVLDAYDIEKAHIVGYSLGGLVAQLMVIENSERVLSMTSIAVGPATHSIELPPIPQETLDLLLSNKPTQNFEKDLPGWMRSWELLQGSYPMEKEMAIQYTKDIYEYEPSVGIAWNHIAVQCAMPDMIDELRNITIPCLIIHGEEDKLQPVEYGIATAQLIPQAELEIIPKVGHVFFNRQLWQHIAAIILKFINSATIQKI